MFNSGSDWLVGNLHKGYVEAIDSPSLKSESSLILVLQLSVCVSVCAVIFACMHVLI